MSQIPGPKGHWLLGSLSEFQNAPLEFLTRSAQRYGNLFQFRMGPVSIIIANDPDDPHQILVKLIPRI